MTLDQFLATALGLSKKDSTAIITAADNPRDTPMRRRLLAACELGGG
jgi:hypothetical protein